MKSFIRKIKAMQSQKNILIYGGAGAGKVRSIADSTEFKWELFKLINSPFTELESLVTLRKELITAFGESIDHFALRVLYLQLKNKSYKVSYEEFLILLSEAHGIKLKTIINVDPVGQTSGQLYIEGNCEPYFQNCFDLYMFIINNSREFKINL